MRHRVPRDQQPLRTARLVIPKVARHPRRIVPQVQVVVPRPPRAPLPRAGAGNPPPRSSRTPAGPVHRTRGHFRRISSPSDRSSSPQGCGLLRLNSTDPPAATKGARSGSAQANAAKPSASGSRRSAATRSPRRMTVPSGSAVSARTPGSNSRGKVAVTAAAVSAARAQASDAVCTRASGHGGARKHRHEAKHGKKPGSASMQVMLAAGAFFVQKMPGRKTVQPELPGDLVAFAGRHQMRHAPARRPAPP